MKKNISGLKIALIIWLTLATLYVLVGEYGRLTNFVAKRAYEKGMMDAVTKVVEQAQKCEAFPIYVNDKSANLINSDCLNKE